MTVYAQMGWLDRIVNVNWRTNWLAIGVGAGGHGTVGKLLIQANGLTLGNLWAQDENQIMHCSEIFHTDVNLHEAVTVTYTNVVGADSGPTHSWVREIDQSPDALEFPFTVGTWSGAGDIDGGFVATDIFSSSLSDCIAQLHHAFGDGTEALSPGSTMGPYDHSYDSTSWQRHGTAYINLGKLKERLGAKVRNVTVKVTMTGTFGGMSTYDYTFDFDPSNLRLIQGLPDTPFDDECVSSIFVNSAESFAPYTATFHLNLQTLALS